jgi:hypothetical protein
MKKINYKQRYLTLNNIEMRNSLFIFKPPNQRENIIDKCRECDKDRSIHNFKGCLYRVKQINLHN